MMKHRLATLLRNARNLPAPQPKHGWWALALLGCVLASQSISIEASGTATLPEITVSQPITLENPATMSERDASLYATVFEAQARGDYKAADAWVAEIENTNLLGYVLAERYLAADYKAQADDLKNWLDNYADHPHAARIAALAQSRGVAVAMPAAEKPLRGNGYTDHLGRTTMPAGWYRGIALWRDKKYGDAEQLFANVAEDESLGDWQRAAGNYWAYRAANQQGKTRGSYAYLNQAASFQNTFYGLLANQQTGTLTLSARAPHVATSTREDGRAIRAALLAQIGRTSDAEDELRHLYSAVGSRHRAGIVTLASELGLANLQVRLSSMAGLDEEEALFAKYPLPPMMIEAQADVNPALLLAIARNESGFREVATSSAGALGLMQMMPATARAVERQVGRDALELASSGAVPASMAERLSDPAMSARFGAEYIKILMREPAIGNNLVRLLAGYNAGPGNVASWQAAAKHMESDPLLYIESIPYPETRNYVMQVMAQYWIYQSLMGQTPKGLATLSHGDWPKAS